MIETPDVAVSHDGHWLAPLPQMPLLTVQIFMAPHSMSRTINHNDPMAEKMFCFMPSYATYIKIILRFSIIMPVVLIAESPYLAWNVEARTKWPTFTDNDFYILLTGNFCIMSTIEGNSKGPDWQWIHIVSASAIGQQTIIWKKLTIILKSWAISLKSCGVTELNRYESATSKMFLREINTFALWFKGITLS